MPDGNECSNILQKSSQARTNLQAYHTTPDKYVINTIRPLLLLLLSIGLISNLVNAALHNIRVLSVLFLLLFFLQIILVLLLAFSFSFSFFFLFFLFFCSVVLAFVFLLVLIVFADSGKQRVHAIITAEVSSVRFCITVTLNLYHAFSIERRGGGEGRKKRGNL